jgi:serine/threonine-protein kinase
MTIDLDTFAAACLHRYIESIRLVREIGRGSRGIVFAGFQESLGRKVAVKLFPGAPHADAVAECPARREAVMLSTLDHPNIIRLIGYGELADCCYIVMPLFEGGSLRTFLRRSDGSKKPLSMSACVDLLLPVLDALAFVHAHGLVHRDVKPSNILIDARRTPCLADLESAGVAGSPAHAGSALYLSPEQAAGRGLDPRSDLYSLGVVLFEMAAADLPVALQSPDEIIRCKRTAPREFFTGMPGPVMPPASRPLERIIRKATAPEPDDRYADCRAFAADLAALRPVLEQQP